MVRIRKDRKSIKVLTKGQKDYLEKWTNEAVRIHLHRLEKKAKRKLTEQEIKHETILTKMHLKFIENQHQSFWNL